MTQQDIDKLACKMLIERAMNADTLSKAYFLVDTANRLDKTIDTSLLKQEIVNNWNEKLARKRGL